jgi:tRNA(Ile)-lysidine synthase
VAYGELSVSKAAPSGAPTASVPVVRPEQLPEGVPAALLDLHPHLVLRGRQPGDRIRLPGGTKLLSDLLIDRKVPRPQRDRLRVLAAGSQLYWVEGVALASGGEGAALELEPDRRHMRTALQQARLAAEAGEVPIGAVVVSADGRVLAAAHNRTEEAHDPTAHAELLALRAAAAVSGDWRLAGATLYVTLEPCPMCLGAVLQTHLARLVFGADNLRDGALGGVTDIRAAGWKRVPTVRGGVEAKAAAALLKRTFSGRR